MEELLNTTLNAIKLDKDTNLLPENLKQGITCLGVEGEYEGQEINNQNKVITKNGAYTADTGYTGLGIVQVNVQNEATKFPKIYDENPCSKTGQIIRSGFKEIKLKDAVIGDKDYFYNGYYLFVFDSTPTVKFTHNGSNGQIYVYGEGITYTRYYDWGPTTTGTISQWRRTSN